MPQLIEALGISIGWQRGLDNLCVGEAGIGEQLADFVGYELAPIILPQIGLRECHDAMLDAQEFQNGQVLTGLGHHRVVGRDNQQRHVDSCRPGHHILHEPLVPWHIDNSQLAVAHLELGETDVDRQAPLLFLR